MTESHSTRACKKVLIDLLFERNLRIYQKHLCLVKTPDVAERLFVRGVKNTVVSPVGLDPDLLNPEYANASVSELRAKYGYTADEKILLFIGRLTEEKQPLRLIDIFSRLAKKDASYRLLIVGSGELEQEVLASIARCHLEDKVTLVPGIPNAEIWQLYRIADAFVNLNPQEIFGMAILEAR